MWVRGEERRGEEIVRAPATIVPIAAAENRGVVRVRSTREKKKGEEGSEPLASLNKNTTLIYERESPYECSGSQQSHARTHTHAESRCS